MIHKVMLNAQRLAASPLAGLVTLSKEERNLVYLAWGFNFQTVNDPPPWVADRLTWSMDRPGAIRFVPHYGGPEMVAIMNVPCEGQEIFAVIGPGSYFLKWGESEIGFIDERGFESDYVRVD